MFTVIEKAIGICFIIKREGTECFLFSKDICLCAFFFKQKHCLEAYDIYNRSTFQAVCLLFHLLYYKSIKPTTLKSDIRYFFLYVIRALEGCLGRKSLEGRMEKRKAEGKVLDLVIFRFPIG